MPLVLENPPTRTIPAYGGWAVPNRLGLRTRSQWERDGRMVKVRARAAAVVVPGDGRKCKLYAEEQTEPHGPFEADCLSLLDFVNPDRDRYNHKPSTKGPEAAGWPEARHFLDDRTWRRACDQRKWLAVRGRADGFYRWFAVDLDFHPADRDWGRFQARVRAVLDLRDELGLDHFCCSRTARVSGLHVWVFWPEAVSYRRMRAAAEEFKELLLQRHPTLFDDKLELYPDTDQPFRLPLYPGRCPVLDTPLDNLGPREQLARLVAWVEHPGRPMAAADLLAWLDARRPSRPQPAPVVTLPAEREEPPSCPILEDFLADIAARYTPRPPDFPSYDILYNVPAVQWRPVWDLRHEIGLEAANARLDELLAAARRPPTPPPAAPPERALEGPATATGPEGAAGADELAGRPQAANPNSLPSSASGSRPGATDPNSSVSRASGLGPKPVYQGQFFRLMHEFWGLKDRPADDTIDFFVLPHNRLALYFGHSPEEVDEYNRRELPRRDASFSDRLTDDPEAYFRKCLNINRLIAAGEGGNGHQPDPESSAIWDGIVAIMKARGEDPLDPGCWGRLLAGAGKERLEIPEHRLTYADRLKAKAAVGWLHPDIAVVYKAVRLVVGFAGKHPGRQLAAVFVPRICSGLGIRWECPSDHRGGKLRRCKRAERFLRALVGAGLLAVAREKLFFGPHAKANKATEYAPGPALQADALRAGTGEDMENQGPACSTYWGHGPRCHARFLVLGTEVRRLTRRLRQVRGPPREAA